MRFLTLLQLLSSTLAVCIYTVYSISQSVTICIYIYIHIHWTYVCTMPSLHLENKSNDSCSIALGSCTMPLCLFEVVVRMRKKCAALLLLVTTGRLQDCPCVFMLLYLIGLRLHAITDDQFGAPSPYIPLCVAISRRFQIALFHWFSGYIECLHI